ncbi:MAG: hypothetical protein LBU90_03770 [Bacteroidales bacterium]|jgi:hypothetical protein|nr:hypothetical protein [Bacteroidales bacterium]
MKTRYKNEIAYAIGISTEVFTKELHTPPLFTRVQEFGYRMTHKRLYGAALEHVCAHYGITEADFEK